MTTYVPSDLHAVIVQTVDAIRQTLGAADIGYFEFKIECEGRTQTGACEVKINYTVSPGSYSQRVTGNSVNAVVSEVLRRHGWDETHAPLSLAAPVPDGWAKV